MKGLPIDVVPRPITARTLSNRRTRKNIIPFTILKQWNQMNSMDNISWICKSKRCWIGILNKADFIKSFDRRSAFIPCFWAKPLYPANIVAFWDNVGDIAGIHVHD